jgi:hypothetical protein
VIAAAAEVAALLLLAPPMATEVVTELPTTWAPEPPEEGSSPLDCCRRMDMDMDLSLLPSSSRIMTL